MSRNLNYYKYQKKKHDKLQSEIKFLRKISFIEQIQTELIIIEGDIANEGNQNSNWGVFSIILYFYIISTIIKI